jgi:hypothetical protein
VAGGSIRVIRAGRGVNVGRSRAAGDDAVAAVDEAAWFADPDLADTTSSTPPRPPLARGGRRPHTSAVSAARLPRGLDFEVRVLVGLGLGGGLQLGLRLGVVDGLVNTGLLDRGPVAGLFLGPLVGLGLGGG